MSSFQLLINQVADTALHDALSLIEVEENFDMPSAMQLTMAVSSDDCGELMKAGDAGLQPFANLVLVVEAEDKKPQPLFDGYVLSHKLHLQAGAGCSTLTVWLQDATWLMNLEEKVQEWGDFTDVDVAQAIFSRHKIIPAAKNADPSSPCHPSDRHSLMQRGSDIQFLRMLARRNGKVCRVVRDALTGTRIGHFADPDLSQAPAQTIVAIDPEAPTVASLDFEWDVTGPAVVEARQAVFDDASPHGTGATVEESGLETLDARGLSAFSGKTMAVLLAAPVDEAGELKLRAQSVLREAGWFVRCAGETDAARLKSILRAGTIVSVTNAGTLYSGRYLVWSVRHSITTASHTMKFVLVRNAMGKAS